MKTTKTSQGAYSVTGHTKAGDLVQYEVARNGHGWSVDLVYGNGAVFNMLYPTKAEAIAAIAGQ
jgi:septal ring-binding cell division protein DamX